LLECHLLPILVGDLSVDFRGMSSIISVLASITLFYRTQAPKENSYHLDKQLIPFLPDPCEAFTTAAPHA